MPPAGASYGYGIMRAGDWIGHGGSVHGWVAMTAFDMQTGTTFMAIVNSGGGEGALEPLAAYLLLDAPFTQQRRHALSARLLAPGTVFR